MGLEENYQNLANAIVKQAAKDWLRAMKRLKKKPGNKAAQETRDECERFFRSGWFEQLTGADGEFLLRKLKEEL